MDFFNKAISSATGSDVPVGESQGKKHSTTELFSSAKVVAGAAQATLANQSDKIDKEKVAGAGGDLLGGAREYGKLDENEGLGKYVSQGETYLRSYGSSEKTVDPPAAVVADAPAAVVADAPAAVVADAPAAAVAEAPEVVMEKKEGGGAGDYFKKAEGYLK